MALTWPLNAPVRISQFFADGPSSIQPRGHTGMDFAVPIGTTVLAAGNGTVVWADWATKLSANNPWWIAPAYAGIVVVIDHGNGLLSLYAHLNGTHLNIGDRVAQGSEIGKSGNTGLSTGPHLHFEIIPWPIQPYNGFYGRVNPSTHISSYFTQAASLGANQRLAGSDTVNQRAAANTGAAVVRVIPGNTVETFTGFVYGESVSGINIWYKDDLGYAWAGGFTAQKTDGLQNLTPVSAGPNQRIAGTDNVNQRAEPNASAAVVRIIPGKSLEQFTGFVRGENISGINIWYKDDVGYAWAGGFESQDTTGLPDVTPKPVPAGTKFKVGGAALNQRKLPYTTSEVIRVIPENTEEVFTEYSMGDVIDGNSVWFKDVDGYVWSGGFTSQDVTGLNRVTAPANPIPPVPEQPPVVEPVPTPETPTPVNSLMGVDISNHQVGISPSTLGADFIIIKASEGVGWEDPHFKAHLANVRATGALVGFYHFARPLATPENTVKAEADSFYNIIKNYIQVGDIVVLDWEAENQNNTIWAEAWLDQVAKLTNSSPLIYMNLSTANAYNWTTVQSKYKLWLAQYPVNAPTNLSDPGKSGIAKGWNTIMWQYTSSGKLAGWNGSLDLNVFYGGKEDWKALGYKVATPVPVPEPIPTPTPTPDPIPIPDPVIPTPGEVSKEAQRKILTDFMTKLIDDYLA